MRRYLAYLKYVLLHKWFVLIECCHDGMPWRGLLHDISKLLPSEFVPYARHFYNRDGTHKQVRDATGYKPTDAGDHDFDFAWLLHQKRNRHHWQWWVLPKDGGGTKILEMTDRDRREALADWRGAAQAQNHTRDSVREWYHANKDKMQLGPVTRAWVERQLDYPV